MIIPGLSRPIMNRDVADTAFNQSPGQQAAIGVRRSPYSSRIDSGSLFRSQQACLGVENQSGHGSLKLRGMAAVALPGKNRSDLLFEEIVANPLSIQGRQKKQRATERITYS